MALRGGVKFSNNNKLNKTPISYDFFPSKVVYDLKGCSVLCGMSDSVVAGQNIATSKDGFCYHSSVTGKVVLVDDGRVEISPIENSEDFVNMPLFEGKVSKENREDVIAYIAKSGIMYGNEPLFSVLSKCIENDVSRLVINCMECLPFSAVAYRTVLQMPAEVVGGAKLLLSLLGIRTGVFAIEKKKRKLASAIEHQNYDKEMFVISMMPSVYPYSDPKIIASELFFATPYDKILTVTPQLCLQVYDAFVHGIPYVGHTVSVIGGKQYANLYIPSGSLIDDIEDQLNMDVRSNDGYGYYQSSVIINNPICGELSESPTVLPIMESLMFFAADNRDNSVNKKCIECGRCAVVCPMELDPLLLYHAVKRKDEGLSKLYGIEKCIKCGCCSYICPAGIEHVDLFKNAKNSFLINTNDGENGNTEKLEDDGSED